MEFAIALGTAVPGYRWDTDPDAEHTAIMNDMRYGIEADRAGFKYILQAEHHFLEEYSHTSASDVQFGYLAHATTRVHLLAGIFNPLPTVNHPAKVAERVAMLDHLSGGRFEFGTGRGAGSHEILAFLPGVEDMDATRAIWEDVIAEFPKMWMQETYEGHQSEFWSLPPRKVLPKPWGKAHPPMWYAAGSTSSWASAGRKGLGVLGFSISSLETAELAVAAYKSAIAEAEPVGAFVNDYLMAVSNAMVSTDEDRAFGWASSPEFAYHTSQMFRYHDTFPRPRSIPAWPEIQKPMTPAQIASSRRNGVPIGDVGFAIETYRKWEAAGVDGVLIAVGPYGDEHAMETIEVFGEHIIPELDRDPVHRTTRFREAAERDPSRWGPSART